MENFTSGVQHLILPSSTVALILVTHVLRMVYSEMVDVLKPITSAAWLKGLSRRRSCVCHALLTVPAFARQPACLIFDEPTTAMDVISSAQILDLYARLREETGIASLYVSHDLALVSKVAHRVCVLERGSIVELADSCTLFNVPRHDYTLKTNRGGTQSATACCTILPVASAAIELA